MSDPMTNLELKIHTRERIAILPNPGNTADSEMGESLLTSWKVTHS